jgi:hypothetical protein
MADQERRALDAWTPMEPPAGFVDRVMTARTMPRRLLVAALAATGVVAAVAAILVFDPRPTPPPQAVVTRTDGAVEARRQQQPWRDARVGTELFAGDAVRTADRGAELLLGGRARLEMQPFTVLRFGDAKVAVELGSIELSGTGAYAFDVGEIRLLDQARVRVSHRGTDRQEIVLLVGQAQVASVDGSELELPIGRTFEVSLSIGAVAIVSSTDAGVALAADAPVALDPEAISIAVTGTRAELQDTSSPSWRKVPPGPGTLAPDSKVRLGAGTTATITAGAVDLGMAAGSRAHVRADRSIALELGTSTITAEDRATIAAPGGTIALVGSPASPAAVRAETTRPHTRVTVTRGNARLVGDDGGELDLRRGETAIVTRDGGLRVVHEIPRVSDLRVNPGETLTIHDPRGRTPVQFAVGDKCKDGGVIELDRDARFNALRSSAGKDTANMMIEAGAWAYQLRCTVSGRDGAPVARGRIAVRRDSGSRPLPKLPALNPIDADGRTYRVSYQSVIPTMLFRLPGDAGANYRLHLATGGREETFDSTRPAIRVDGSKLAERVYTFWFDRNGVKDTKVSTLIIDFVQTAPQIYISDPGDGQTWSDPVVVRGAALPGWTVTIDGVTVPVDAQRRFTASVAKPPRAIAIRVSHPERGVHYYLRRPK